MATLVLQPAGANIAVACSKAGKNAPINIGDESPSFNGALRNSVRLQKHVWTAVTIPIDTATENSIQSLIANQAQIPVTGTLLSNATPTCSVVCTASEMVIGGLFWVMSLTIREA
jgi:hypothetical protein